MTQQQRKQKLNEKLTNLRVRVAFTSIKSLEREATKLASEFSDYTDELSKELEAQRIRADKTNNYLKQELLRKKELEDSWRMIENDRLRLLKALEDIVTVPIAKSMDNEALILHNIAREVLEGSNTDAKRD